MMRIGQIIEERPGSVCVVVLIDHSPWCKRRGPMCCLGEPRVEWLTPEAYQTRFGHREGKS
jgi:hypothetical protein